MKRNLGWLTGIVILAALFHVATIALVPRFMMGAVLHRLGKLGVPGSIVHAPRADEHSRQVVMPSPDLLYSYCVYDLDHGPLPVHAEVPPGTYWSLSAFDANTDNYFAINDRTVRGGGVDLIVAPVGTILPLAGPDVRIVYSPSRRGLLLFRTLVDEDARLPALDAARRQARCGG